MGQAPSGSKKSARGGGDDTTALAATAATLAGRGLSGNKSGRNKYKVKLLKKTRSMEAISPLDLRRRPSEGGLPPESKYEMRNNLLPANQLPPVVPVAATDGGPSQTITPAATGIAGTDGVAGTTSVTATAGGGGGPGRPQPGRNKLAIALYSYQSPDESELDFRKGDRLMILDDNDPDWWLARTLVDQRDGFVPRNFIVFEPLEMEEWFHGNLARKDAQRRLLYQDDNPRGTFLVRNSDSRLGFSLSVRDRDPNRGGDHVKHYRIRAVDGGFCITSRRVFSNLPELIDYYRSGNNGLGVQLTRPLARSEPDFWPGRDNEISRDQLEFAQKLGAGNFGDVYFGIYRGKVEVAIKTLKPGSMTPQAFLEEAAVMRKYRHDKLVRLYGVSLQEPLLIVTEFMCNGSLLSFLRDHPEGRVLENEDMVFMAAQVASGMKYLEAEKLIHRDLAARNILVGKAKIVKVADFGLAKLIGDDEYEMKRGTKFPIKWTAPEAVCYGRFSSKADVWSFGVLLWELWTRGQVPYPEMPNREVIDQIQRGYRMPRPAGCPDHIYKAMLNCWDADPERRSNFVTLADFFDNYADENPSTG